MKSVIDFFKKKLPDTAPFPNFVGGKIFNTKAYIKKSSRLMVDYYLIFEFLGQNFRRPQKFKKSQK
jgi:hypothetical protein